MFKSLIETFLQPVLST